MDTPTKEKVPSRAHDDLWLGIHQDDKTRIGIQCTVEEKLRWESAASRVRPTTTLSGFIRWALDKMAEELLDKPMPPVKKVAKKKTAKKEVS